MFNRIKDITSYMFISITSSLDGYACHACRVLEKFATTNVCAAKELY